MLRFDMEVDYLPTEMLSEQAQRDLAEVGGRIRAIREGRGMTLKDFAEVIPADAGERKNPKVLSRYELGSRQMRVTTFFSFAEALHVTPNDISPARLLSQIETLGQIFSELNEDDQNNLRDFAFIMRSRHGRKNQGRQDSPAQAEGMT